MANARAAGRLANVFLLTAVLVSAQVSSGPTPPTKIPPSVASAVQVVAGIAVARLKQQEDVNKVRNAIVIRGDDLAAFAVAAALAGDQVKSVEYEPAYIASVETKRTDKQVGASSFVSGSTSAVSKPSVPQLLGLAIDYGAIAQNINGSTVTLSSSPYALLASLKGDTAQTYDQYSGYGRLGLSASFNLQNANDPLASVTRKQLTEWAARFRVLGDHSGRSPLARAKFRDLVLPKLQFTANLQSAEHDAIFGSSGTSQILEKFGGDLNKALRDYLTTSGTVKDYQDSISKKKPDSAKAAKLVDEISSLIEDLIQKDIYDEFSQIPHDSNAMAAASAFMMRYQSANVDYSKAAKAFDEALKELENLSTLTLAYLQERGSGTPDYSVVQFLFEKKPKNFMQVDANVSASFYQNPDRTKNEQTFRDVNAALGLQQNLGRSPFLRTAVDQSQVTISFNGRYERLQENRHIPGKKADIGIANFKLEIPVGSGISLPLSFTYANSTELIKETDVRGNFGISFDLDKLFAVVKPQ